MKVNVRVEFECCENGIDKGMCEGQVTFDEFGIVKGVSVFGGLGPEPEQKEKARRILKNVAQRARTEIIN